MNYISLENLFLDYGFASIADVEQYLQHNTTVETQGKIYTREQVRESLFSNKHISVETRLEYDRLIDENPPLKDLLINYQVDLTNSRWYRVEYNLKFIHFISPYYADAFDVVMQAYLDNGELDQAGKWINYTKFLLHEDKDMAFASAGEYLYRIKDDLEEQKKEGGFSTTIPAEWGTVTWSNFLNGLPKSLENVRLAIISLLMNYMLIFRDNPNSYSLHVSQNLTELKDIPLDMYNVIHSSHRKMHRLDDYDASSESSGGFFKSTTWTIIVILLIIVRIVIRCNR